jgi:type IV secretion system protein VirB10
MLLHLRLTILVIAAALLCPADQDRNFAGTWKLDSAQSNVSSARVPAAASLRISHEGESIVCTADDPRAGCALKTDGSESRRQVDGSTVSTRTKWEGRALLVNSIVSGQRNYTIMDRWVLSNDYNTLRIRRTIVGSGGETESVLVYRREGVEQATVRPAPARREDPERVAVPYIVEAGTKIPLKIINSVSTKNSGEGDRIYLQTAFPIMAKGRIVIPPGSYVAGTLTRVVRPGRLKGRGELYLRFDSLTLPNGITRDFRARPGGLDGDAGGILDRDEGRITGDGNKTEDARKVGETAAAGASVGAIAGSVGGRTAMGAGIGAASGAAAGLAGVLLSRGPDTVLRQGTTVEMILDRDLRFEEAEINFTTMAR